MYECEKSPTGKHEWIEVEPKKLEDGREDWSIIPGTYCVHCGEDKLELDFSGGHDC